MAPPPPISVQQLQAEIQHLRSRRNAVLRKRIANGIEQKCLDLLVCLRSGTRHMASRGDSYNRPSEQVVANLTPYEAYEFRGRRIPVVVMHKALREVLELHLPERPFITKAGEVYRSADAAALEVALQAGDSSAMSHVTLSQIADARPALKKLLEKLAAL